MTRQPAPFDRAAVIAAARPQLEAFEREASALVRGFQRSMPIVLAVPIAAALLGGTAGGFAVGAFIGFVIAAVWLIARVLTLATRVLDARARVLEAVAPALGLDYAPEAPEPVDLAVFEGTYYGSLLKNAQAEDVLSGERGGAPFILFDAKLRARARPNGGAPPKWLGGLVFGQTRVARVAMPGRWTSRVVVVRDYGLANRLTAPKGMDRVRLVDPAFEDVFEVYATDQTEARALLHPQVMEQLKSLEDLFDVEDSPAVAVFDAGHFYLASPSRPPSSGALNAEKIVRDAEISFELLVDEIEALMRVVDALAGPTES